MVNQIYGKKTNQNPCSSKIKINNSEANKIKQSGKFIFFSFYLHPNALVSFSLI